MYAMLPPFVKALGPVKEWFSTWFVNTFMAKYQDLSDSASIEKVCLSSRLHLSLAGSGRPELLSQCSQLHMGISLWQY